jgi:acyl carrier protein
MNHIQEQIKNYIVTQFAFDHSTLEPADDLLNQGIVDSIGILQLVTYIEETFHIQINDDEITPENFRSLSTLTNFVMQKVQ